MATIEEEEGRREKRPKTCWSPPSSHGAGGGDVEGAHEKTKSKLSSDGGSGINEKSGSSGEAWLTGTIDLAVLNCAFCSRELSPPIFQCYNGRRLACSSCMHKADSFRDLAVEKIIKYIRVPCPYANSGCEQLISFLTVRVHRKMCEYSPCRCPAANCNLEAPTRELYHHFVQAHPGRRSISFKYNRQFSVFMSKDEHIRVLRSHEDGVLFLLYMISEAKLRKVMVACLGPESMDWKYTYKVKARDGEEVRSVQLKSPMITIRGWEDLELLPEKYFLLIPERFGGGLYLDLKITI